MASKYETEKERFINYGGNVEERQTQYAINQRRGWQKFIAEEGASTHHMTEEKIREECNGDEELIAAYYARLDRVHQGRRWGNVNIHPAIVGLGHTTSLGYATDEYPDPEEQ